MDGRKPQKPTVALLSGTHCCPCPGTSQCVKGLVKELVCPQCYARILRPKEGSKGYEGREVRDEVPAHNWHLRQFESRFRSGKEHISRPEEEVRDVDQGSHLEFTQALPKRNVGKYVEAELGQRIFAAPFINEEWLQAAMILLFDAVGCWSRNRNMREHDLYRAIYHATKHASTHLEQARSTAKVA